MKNILKLSVLVILFFAANSYAQMSFNDGLATAKSSNKKIVLFIGTGSDNWTKKMLSEVYSNDGVKTALANFVWIELDADSKSQVTYNGKTMSPADLARAFNSTGYPTHVFLNPDGSIIKFKYNGEEVMNFPGYVEASEFQKMLNYFNSGQYKDTDLNKVL